MTIKLDREQLRSDARQRMLQRRMDAAHRGELDPAKLLDELELHQIELEVQNEQLRAAQVELERSEARFAHLFESAPLAYLLLSRDGVIQEVNPAACALLGLPAPALRRRPLRVHAAEHSRDLLFAHLQAVGATRLPQSCVVTLATPRGPRHVRLESAPSQEGLLMMVVDVTRAREIEDALLESEERNRRVLEAITQQAVLGLDTLGRIRLFNPGAEGMLGYRAPELMGEPLATLWRVTQADALAPVLTQVEREGAVTLEATWYSRDGRALEVRASITRSVDVRGMLQGFVCVAQDLTRAGQSLLRASRDARTGALGEAALVIRESIATPLTQALLEAGSTGMVTIERCLERAAAAAARWSPFAPGPRPTPGGCVPAAQLLERTRALLPADARVKFPVLPDDVSPDLWIAGDAGQLTIALTSVLAHALGTAPGLVELRAGSVEVRNPALPLQDGPHVRFTIRHDGLEHPPAQGTPEPVGLASARAAISAHRGVMVTDAHEGEGTSTFIYLPRSAPAPAERPLHGVRVFISHPDALLRASLTACARSLGMVPVDGAAEAQLALTEGDGTGFDGMPVVRMRYSEARVDAACVTLEHPFGTRELADAMRRALSSRE